MGQRLLVPYYEPELRSIYQKLPALESLRQQTAEDSRRTHDR